MAPKILIDDASPSLSYSGTQWAVNKGAASAYNQTLTICTTDNTTTLKPQFALLFYGSELALYGPQNGDNVTVSYAIDGSSRRSAQLSKSAIPSQNSLKLWSLEGMDSTYHDIAFFPEAGTFSFDYITITPNVYSSLVGRQLVVDDGDSQIQYSSGWAAPSNGTMESIVAQGIPFGGGFKGTNTANANMTFDFTGSSISVFGLLNQQAGRLSFSYSVDNSAPETVTPFDGTQTPNNVWQLNQEFFHKDLGPGKHSVILKVLEVTGSQALWLDYVVFEGSSSTTISPSSTGGTTASPTTTTTTSGHSHSPLTASQTGGIVVMALVLLFLCCFGEKCLQISRRKRGRYANSDRVTTTSSGYPSESLERPIIVVVPPSSHSSSVIHNHSFIGTPPYNTYSSNSPALPVTYHAQTMPIRDAGPAEAPPPYNPNLYIP